MATKLDKTKLTRGILHQLKLAPYLDDIILNSGDFDWRYEMEAKKGDDAFHPSSHCLPDPVQLYLSIMDPEPGDNIIGSSLRKTFQVGHFWHGYLQHLIVEKLGFAGWDDIEAKGTKVWGINGDGSPKPFHHARGSADVAPCRIPKYGDYLIDFKTMNASDFRTSGLPARFRDKYTCQANIYMDFFDLEKCLILKIQKDSPHDFDEVEIYRNQKLIDAIYEKWYVVSSFIAEKLEPPHNLEMPLPLEF